jgi:hypothetical protein
MCLKPQKDTADEFNHAAARIYKLLLVILFFQSEF